MASFDEKHWVEEPDRLEHYVSHLESADAARMNLDRVLLRLYHGRPIALPTTDARRPSNTLQDVESMKAGGFCLAREVGDAAAALVCRLPAVKVLPDGQQFKRQRGAKLMSRYLNGVFYDNRVKRLAPALFNDEICTRMGALKWYFDRKAKKIKCERLNSLWLHWDDQEGPAPRCLYYVAPASRRFLMATYPKFADAIRTAPRWQPTTVPMVGFNQARETDTIKVVEAWALPAGDQPGKHLIQVGKDTNLVDERYDFDRFPVVPFRWTESRNSYGSGSYGGKPLLEIIFNHHLWYNKLTRIMGEASRGAVPKLLLHELAEVMGTTADKVMETIRWRGPQKPEIVAPQTISVDIWKLRELIKQNAYELGGVNQQIAQGATSDNLKSAPAQRERMDIASTRLIHPTEGFEEGWRESAEVICMLSSKVGGKIASRVEMGNWLREINWEDIELAEGEYGVEIQSTAALPLTVGGRLDFVNDLAQLKDDNGLNLVKARDVLGMLRVPDTEAAMDRITAPQNLANFQVEEALWEGNYIPPEPIQDLDMLISTASNELMNALQNGTFPEENLELGRRLIAEAKMLQKPAPTVAPLLPNTVQAAPLLPAGPSPGPAGGPGAPAGLGAPAVPAGAAPPPA